MDGIIALTLLEFIFVSLAGPKLTEIPHVCLLNAGIKGVHCHTWLLIITTYNKIILSLLVLDPRSWILSFPYYLLNQCRCFQTPLCLSYITFTTSGSHSPL